MSALALLRRLTTRPGLFALAAVFVSAALVIVWRRRRLTPIRVLLQPVRCFSLSPSPPAPHPCSRQSPVTTEDNFYLPVDRHYQQPAAEHLSSPPGLHLCPEQLHGRVVVLATTALANLCATPPGATSTIATTSNDGSTSKSNSDNQRLVPLAGAPMDSLAALSAELAVVTWLSSSCNLHIVHTLRSDQRDEEERVREWMFDLGLQLSPVVRLFLLVFFSFLLR